MSPTLALLILFLLITSIYKYELNKLRGHYNGLLAQYKYQCGRVISLQEELQKRDPTWNAVSITSDESEESTTPCLNIYREE